MKEGYGKHKEFKSCNIHTKTNASAASRLLSYRPVYTTVRTWVNCDSYLASAGSITSHLVTAGATPTAWGITRTCYDSQTKQC